MEETTLMPSAKAVFFTIKTIYPKYHPVWFILYMYLIYYRIAKRKLQYVLRPVPTKLISDILNRRYFDDINNTVAVCEKNLYSHDKVLLLYAEGSNFYRPVYILPTENCKNDEILLSDTMYHNLKQMSGENFQLLEYKESFVPIAEELDISMISSPFDISNAIIDAVLAKFFKVPKLMGKGDIFEINIKYYAPEIFYKNSKINHVENIYFKCNQIGNKGDEKEAIYFCVIGHTEIRQSPNIQCYLPKRFYKNCSLNIEEGLRTLPFCPYGLQDHLEKLQKSIRPFLVKSMCNRCLIVILSSFLRI